MGADERRIKGEIADKRAIEKELRTSKDKALKREADRQAQEQKNLKAELRSRKGK